MKGKWLKGKRVNGKPKNLFLFRFPFYPFPISPGLLKTCRTQTSLFPLSA